MDKPNIDKVKLESSNIADENFEKLASLFPNVVTETIIDGQQVRAIDKDKLMQEINSHVVEGLEERYNFSWPDKRKSVVLANAPTRNTLRACKEESKDFDKTENLYIEGDNLEVLKLLRNTYMGKVKMIYIDPPYNTGKDFVYKDNFFMSKEDYLENSGQIDENGNKYFPNTETNGRYHTDWLNMMYPRLKMARDLLTDDGAIFISIDDNEVSNLRKICDEIFGESNFVCQFVATSAPAGTQSSIHVAIQHSYCLFYSKSINKIQVSCLTLDNNSLNKKYSEKDSFGNYYLERLWKRGIGGRKEDVPSLHFPVFYDEINNKIIFCNELDKYNQNQLIEIIPYQTKGVLGRWTWSQEHMIKERHLLYVKKVNGEYKLFKKQYMDFDKGNKIKSIIISDFARTELGSIELKNLMNVKVFDYPKSSKFIKEFLKVYTKNSDIILDFFSGSATTAHAVMQLNAEDGGGE